jgi:serine/threonine protein phosphatase PrpC
LILHYWAAAAEAAAEENEEKQPPEPTPTKYLQSAYERTLEVTTKHNWQGTTTACGAQLYFKPPKDSSSGSHPTPVLYITNLGDCQVLVLRPSTREVLYKSHEQWHWFDCPRQLGTNSPDTPERNAVTDTLDIEVGDVVLAMTDGVIDNLWEHEIVDTIVKSIEAWEKGNTPKVDGDRTGGRNGGMRAAAQDLVAAAKKIAMDPFAESPFMEHAIEEGLASEGGKVPYIRFYFLS